MPRLPQVGSDNNSWGDVLNEFLRVSHNDDGTLKNLSASEIVDMIEGLSGDERLSYSKLKDQLTGGSIVSLLSSLTGDSRLSLNALKDTSSSSTSETLKTENKWRIKITPSNVANIDNIQLTIPKLKYNKKAFWAFTVDDGYLGVYSLLQRYVNKRVVTLTTSDNLRQGRIAHDGRPRLTTDKSTRYVGYTDGCGNMIPFRFGCSWFTYNNYGVDLHENNSYLLDQMWWSEAIKFLDFFGSIYNHELGGQSNAIASLNSNQSLIKNQLSYTPNVMVRPNGDDSYIDAAEKIDDFLMMTTEGSYKVIYSNINLYNNNDLYKLVLPRTNIGLSDQTVINRKAGVDSLMSQISGTNIPFRHEFTHLIVSGTGANDYDGQKDVLNYIHDTYGAGGTDEIWGGTLSELIEYLNFRENVVIERSVQNNNVVVFDVTLKSDYRYLFKELSFMISGITNESEVTSISGEQYGLSKSVKSGNNLLLNICYNSNLLDKADKYLTLAENNTNSEIFSEYLQDAAFFVSKLSTDFKVPYQSRLNALSSSPVLNSVSINSGATETANDNVSISLDITGSATQYKISEQSDLSGSTWQSYNGSSINYTFSNQTIETKTIYIQVQNDYGTSSIVSDNISYLGVILSLDSVVINSGDLSTQNSNVSVAVTYSNGTPTYYKIGEDSDLANSSWVSWVSSPISYNLSGTGSRTVYVQIKNANTESLIISDSITYSSINLQSISIDSGASTTSDADVSVAFTYTGSPSHYMISENSGFSGASWISWSGSSGSSVLFTLSSSGNKTLYGKMKDSSNNESSVVNSSITYNIPAPTSNKIVISFSNTVAYNALNDTNSYVTLNNEIINYIVCNSYESYTDKALKDTVGTIKGYFVVKPSEMPSESGISLKSFGTQAGNNPILSGDTGSYPDIYFRSYWNISTNSTTSTNRGAVRFKSLSAGTYTVRIYISKNGALVVNENKIKANGVEVFVPAITSNSNNTAVEITNVSVASDGNLDLWFWSPSGRGYVPGFNIIEIIKTA